MPSLKPTKNSKKLLKKKAWSTFSIWIRNRDADDNGICTCVTCGKKDHWKNMQAGHGIGGRNNYLLFNEDLVHAQCRSCNLFKGGEYEKYAVFLIEKYGMDWYKEMLRYKPVQFSDKDYEEIIKKYGQPRKTY